MEGRGEGGKRRGWEEVRWDEKREGSGEGRE